MADQPLKDFVSLTQPPATKLLTTNIPAPTGLYVTDDDFLRVVSQTVLVTQPFFLQYKLLRASDGQISIGSQLFTPPSDGSLNIVTVGLTEGFLLSATIFPVASGGSFRGTCYAALQLGSGSTANPRCIQVLVSDYITPNYGLSWPGGAVRSSLDGPGALQSAGAANPGAGAQFSIAVTPGMRWQLLSLAATLTTSAVVGNRVVAFQMNLGVARQWLTTTSAAQTASTSQVYNLLPGLPNSVVAGATQQLAAPSPAMMGHEIGNTSLVSAVGGMDAGDAWTNIAAWWLMWIES